MHLRFTDDWQEFKAGDEIVVDPDEGGSLLMLRPLDLSYGRLLGALNQERAELIGPSVSTAAIRTVLNLPRSTSPSPRRARRLRLIP